MKTHRSAAIAVVLLVQASLSLACEGPACHRSKPSTVASSPKGESSRIFIDPQTGEVRTPTPEELRDLQAPRAKALSATTAARRLSAAAPLRREMVNPDGAVGVDADEEQASVSVLHVHADGTVSQHCVHGQEAARQVLRKPGASRAAAAASSDR